MRGHAWARAGGPGIRFCTCTRVAAPVRRQSRVNEGMALGLCGIRESGPAAGYSPRDGRFAALPTSSVMAGPGLPDRAVKSHKVPYRSLAFG